MALQFKPKSETKAKRIPAWSKTQDDPRMVPAIDWKAETIKG